MESVDLLAILGRERQVKMRRLLVGLVQAQRNLTLRAELDAVRRRPLRGNGYAERFECLAEERLALCIVADSDLDVVEHDFPEECRPDSFVRWRTATPRGPGRVRGGDRRSPSAD